MTREEIIKNKYNLSGVDLNRDNLSGANFSGANLCRANFSGANFSGANLCRANFCSTKLLETDFIFTAFYNVHIRKEYIKIGCEKHTHEEWNDFTDKKIIQMDGERALTFWRQWKSFILNKSDELRSK